MIVQRAVLWVFREQCCDCSENSAIYLFEGKVIYCSERNTISFKAKENSWQAGCLVFWHNFLHFKKHCYSCSGSSSSTSSSSADTSKRHQVVSLTAFFWTSDKQHHAPSFFSVYFFKQQRRRLRRTIPAWPLRSWYSPWLRIRGCWNSPSWASWLPPAGPKFWPTRLLGARWVRGRPGPGPEKESEVDWLRFWTISSSGGVKHFCFPGSGINSRRSPTFFFKKTIKLMDVELV